VLHSGSTLGALQESPNQNRCFTLCYKHCSEAQQASQPHWNCNPQLQPCVRSPYVLTVRLHLATNTTVESVGLRWLARAYFSSSISTVWPGTCGAEGACRSMPQHGSAISDMRQAQVATVPCQGCLRVCCRDHAAQPYR
jgi:hypothetical protein